MEQRLKIPLMSIHGRGQSATKNHAAMQADRPGIYVLAVDMFIREYARRLFRRIWGLTETVAWEQSFPTAGPNTR